MTKHTFQTSVGDYPSQPFQQARRVLFDGVIKADGGKLVETLLIYTDTLDVIEIVAFHVERSIEAPRLYVINGKRVTAPEINSVLHDKETSKVSAHILSILDFSGVEGSENFEIHIHSGSSGLVVTTAPPMGIQPWATYRSRRDRCGNLSPTESSLQNVQLHTARNSTSVVKSDAFTRETTTHIEPKEEALHVNTVCHSDSMGKSTNTYGGVDPPAKMVGVRGILRRSREVSPKQPLLVTPSNNRAFGFSSNDHHRSIENSRSSESPRDSDAFGSAYWEEVDDAPPSMERRLLPEDRLLEIVAALESAGLGNHHHNSSKHRSQQRSHVRGAVRSDEGTAPVEPEVDLRRDDCDLSTSADFESEEYCSDGHLAFPDAGSSENIDDMMHRYNQTMFDLTPAPCHSPLSDFSGDESGDEFSHSGTGSDVDSGGEEADESVMTEMDLKPVPRSHLTSLLASSSPVPTLAHRPPLSPGTLERALAADGILPHGLFAPSPITGSTGSMIFHRRHNSGAPQLPPLAQSPQSRLSPIAIMSLVNASGSLSEQHTSPSGLTIEEMISPRLPVLGSSSSATNTPPLSPYTSNRKILATPPLSRGTSGCGGCGGSDSGSSSQKLSIQTGPCGSVSGSTTSRNSSASNSRSASPAPLHPHNRAGIVSPSVAERGVAHAAFDDSYVSGSDDSDSETGSRRLSGKLYFRSDSSATSRASSRTATPKSATYSRGLSRFTALHNSPSPSAAATDGSNKVPALHIPVGSSKH